MIIVRFCFFACSWIFLINMLELCSSRTLHRENQLKKQRRTPTDYRTHWKHLHTNRHTNIKDKQKKVKEKRREKIPFGRKYNSENVKVSENSAFTKPDNDFTSSLLDYQVRESPNNTFSLESETISIARYLETSSQKHPEALRRESLQVSSQEYVVPLQSSTPFRILKNQVWSNSLDGRSRPSNIEPKRGLDIGLNLKVPETPKYNNNDRLDELEKLLKQALGGGKLQKALNSSLCPSCEEGTPVPVRRRIKPAYKCDDWDSQLRLCFLERNIGGTVTFYLSAGYQSGHKPNVTWKKEFHMQDSNTRTAYVLNPNNPPQNIIIGKQGYELRISPITEIDIGNTLFSATLHGHNSAQSKLNFVIRIIPADLGFVYVGETIELNLRSYVSLPLESVIFKWYMESYGEHSTLPSNMKTSASGSSIKISELRQEQEGILSCSVYTNMNFLATKKRFLIKDLSKNKDVLQASPDHNLTFIEEHTEEERKKRYHTKRLIDPDTSRRSRRFFSLYDLAGKDKEPSPATDNLDHESSTPSHKDYDLDIKLANEEPGSRVSENLEDIDPDLEEDEQQTQQYDDSEDIDSAEGKERGHVPSIGNSQKLNTKGEISPQIESFVDSRRRPLHQYSSYEESRLANRFSKHPNLHKNVKNTFDKHISDPSLKAMENDKKYNDIDIETNIEDNQIVTEDTGVILNIDKIPGPRRVSAEESISILISSCKTDFECSGSATCFRNSLKEKGFCKCLPGFYGVGIFCRESIWLSHGDFGNDGLPNPGNQINLPES